MRDKQESETTKGPDFLSYGTQKRNGKQTRKIDTINIKLIRSSKIGDQMIGFIKFVF